MEFPSAIAWLFKKAKYPLIWLAIFFSAGLFLLLMSEVVIPLVTPNYPEKSYHQVEITGIEASSFQTPRDDATRLRFNLTARVTSRYERREMCVTRWEADVWYGGAPLGKAYFPKTCLKNMTEAVVTATTSTDLAGVSMANGTTGMLQVEMTECTDLLFDDGTSTGQERCYWLWCKATLGGQSHQPPSPCRIYPMTRAETSDTRFFFVPSM
ncbi:hypothetical protein ACQJBY_026240 [Aegilops geniculata]